MAYELFKAVILGLVSALIFVGVDMYYDHIVYLADLKGKTLINILIFVCKALTYGLLLTVLLDILQRIL